jgi:hypothetical protein
VVPFLEYKRFDQVVCKLRNVKTFKAFLFQPFVRNEYVIWAKSLNLWCPDITNLSTSSSPWMKIFRHCKRSKIQELTVNVIKYTMSEEEGARRITTIEMFFSSRNFIGPQEHGPLVKSLSAIMSGYLEYMLAVTISTEIAESALQVMSSDEYALALKILQRKFLADFLQN